MQPDPLFILKEEISAELGIPGYFLHPDTPPAEKEPPDENPETPEKP